MLILCEQLKPELDQILVGDVIVKDEADKAELGILWSSFRNDELVVPRRDVLSVVELTTV